MLLTQSTQHTFLGLTVLETREVLPFMIVANFVLAPPNIRASYEARASHTRDSFELHKHWLSDVDCGHRESVDSPSDPDVAIDSGPSTVFSASGSD